MVKSKYTFGQYYLYVNEKFQQIQCVLNVTVYNIFILPQHKKIKFLFLLSQFGTSLGPVYTSANDGWRTNLKGNADKVI